MELSEAGAHFTLEEVAEARQAAFDASTEALTRAAEAYLADPQAFLKQAPGPARLIHALAQTKTAADFANIMYGVRRIKGVDYSGHQPGRGQAAPTTTPVRKSESIVPVNRRILSAVRDAVANRGKKETAIPLIEGARVHAGVQMFTSTKRAIAIDSEHVRHILNRHSEITAEDIAAIPEMLQNPRAVLKDGDDGVLVITSRRDDAGRPVLIVLRKARMLSDGEVQESHPRYDEGTRVTGVSTEFGWDASARNIVRGLRDGTVLYLSKEGVARAKELLSTASIAAQSPKGHDNLVPTPGNIRLGAWAVETPVP